MFCSIISFSTMINIIKITVIYIIRFSFKLKKDFVGDNQTYEVAYY